MELVNLDDVAKYNVFTAGNAHWQQPTTICHIVHVALPTNKHRTYLS